MAVTVASQWVEFGLPGVFVIPAIYLWCTQRQPEAALLALVFFSLTVWLNTSFGGWPGLWGTLAVLPIAWGVEPACRFRCPACGSRSISSIRSILR